MGRQKALVVMRLVLVLAALHCLAFIDRTMIGGLLPLLRTSIAMTDAQAGWIIGTAFAVPYGATALTLGALLRGRQASNAWLVGGVLVWTGGSLATGLAGSLSELSAARAAMGIGQGIFVPVAIARLFEATAPTARAQALGFFIGSATAGRSTALLLVGTVLWVVATIASDIGDEIWRWLFIATALPNIAVLIVLGKNRGPASAPEPGSPHVAINWLALLPLFCVAASPVLLAQSVLGWLPTLFVEERGLSPTDAALLIGIVTLFAAPSGPLLAGWLAGRYPAYEDRAPTLVLLALAATLVPLAGLVWGPGLAAGTASMAVMLVILGMALFGGLFGVQLAIPAHARVSVNGVYLAFITMVGLGLGPLITGALSSVAENGTSLGTSLLATGVVAITACAVAVATVSLTRGRAMAL